MSDSLAKLNPEQRAAVVHGNGPLMVLAGAGTGKTRVLTHRIARLVDGGVDPRAILAVTFTNKAAGEMRERIGQLLGAHGQGMWIGTFHATCARLLRQHAEKVKLTKDFTVFDDDDQKRLVSSILKEMNVSEKITPRAILSRIDKAKNAGADPAATQARDYIDDVLRRVAPQYAERLQRENAVDFNDLLLKVLELFDDAELGPRLSRRFDHVLVDEFQDTNRVQYRLVGKLCGTRNLCVVGDDDQSIYAWRGAEPRNLLDFDRDYADAKVVRLERNYRSTSIILAAANAVIAKNVDRHVKSLWTEREGGEPILLEENLDERAEGDFVAMAVRGVVEQESRTLGQCAVLYRTHAQSRALEEALRARRIPYKIVGGLSFFQRREVKDITEYLRLLTNPAADSAFERVVNVPTRGIGETTVDRVRAYARERNLPLLEGARAAVDDPAAQLGAAAKRKLEGFLELIRSLQDLVASHPPVAVIVSQVIERSDYAARLEIEDKTDGPDRLRNLSELVSAAAAYDAEAGPEATLVGFNERIALTGVADSEDGRQGEVLTLMTIHAAKGLEFPVVFVTGLEEGIFPSLRDGDLDGEVEEERRLAYVAFTRAMDRLVLTYARTRRSYDGVRANPASRFLAELPTDCVAVRRKPRPSPSPARPSAFARPASRPQRSYDEHDQRRHGDDEPVYYVDDSGDDDPVFHIGARVRHRIFGVGEIEEGSGRGPDRKLVVRFPSHGVKTIVARFVERV